MLAHNAQRGEPIKYDVLARAWDIPNNPDSTITLQGISFHYYVYPKLRDKLGQNGAYKDNFKRLVKSAMRPLRFKPGVEILDDRPLDDSRFVSFGPDLLRLYRLYTTKKDYRTLQKLGLDPSRRGFPKKLQGENATTEIYGKDVKDIVTVNNVNLTMEIILEKSMIKRTGSQNSLMNGHSAKNVGGRSGDFNRCLS